MGTGETVGEISVGVGRGTRVGVADGLNTIVSEGSGVGGERKLQAGSTIRINMRKSFRILDSCKDDCTSTILEGRKALFLIDYKNFLLKLLPYVLIAIRNRYNNSVFVNSLVNIECNLIMSWHGR